MFNRYNTNVKTESHRHNHKHYPDHMTVEENKAPTDESIKILNEWKEKAKDDVKKEIINNFRIKDNIVNTQAIYFYKKAEFGTMDDKIHCIFKFSINNQEFTIDDEINLGNLVERSEEGEKFFSLDYAFNEANRSGHLEKEVANYCINFFASRISQKIAEEIVKDGLKDIFNSFIPENNIKNGK